MKEWRKTRNYRRIKDESGKIIANIITVDGMDVEVTEEVFLAYSQMDRRERYQQEQQGERQEASLELLEENNVPVDLYLKEHQPSAEENLVYMEDTEESAVRRKKLVEALPALDDEERELLQALFFGGVSARAYARSLGVYPRTIIYRKEKLLEKLRKGIFS